MPEFSPTLSTSYDVLTWAEIETPVGTTALAAPVDVADPGTYYGGYKPPTLLGCGPVRRALSDDEGQYESQRFTVTLSDQARTWRTYLGTPSAARLVLNKRLVVRLLDDTTRRAAGDPRTVAIGLVRSYELG